MSKLPRTVAWIGTGFAGGVLTAASLVLIFGWSPVSRSNLRRTFVGLDVLLFAVLLGGALGAIAAALADERRWRVPAICFALAVGSVCVCLGLPVLPAVLKMREVEATARCRSNLRQISLAVVNYAEEQRGLLPAGTWSKADLPTEERLSWLAAVLPYLEQPATYESLAPSRPWDAEENRRAVQTRLKIFLCPRNDQRAEDGQPALTHYVGMAGVGTDAALLPVTDPRAGAFGYDRRARFPDAFRDGIGMTILVIETASANGPWAQGGPATVRGLDPESHPPFGKRGQFGDSRSAGVCAAFADASVRFLDCRPRTFEALCTMAGGEAISEDF
jgi:hypothetical protein